MPPPVLRFHVPAQIAPVGEISTIWLFEVPYANLLDETETDAPLQVKALGVCACVVCPYVSESPAVTGLSVIDATSVSFKPYPRPLQ
jgi:hypothetical protein